MFLPINTSWLVLQKGNTSIKMKTKSAPLLPLDVPIVVIVDKSTYKGSEIFAAALKNYRNAVVVGDKTYGNYEISSVFTFQNDATLQVKVGKMLDGSGKPFPSEGITPDIKVLDFTTGKRDVVYMKAVTVLQEMQAKKKPK